MQKLDPYLNVDPCTMNPSSTGGLRTEDGAETASSRPLRAFLDRNLHGQANVPTAVYATVSPRSAGEYLGDPVQSPAHHN